MNLLTTGLVLSLVSATPVSPSKEPLCAQRDPCRLVETLEAGKDAQGHALQVKHLTLGWMSQDMAGKATGRKFVAPRQARGSRSANQCEAVEWWLSRAGSPPQLLLALCNDGYGSAGVGKDEVTVGDNVLGYEQSGGGVERWSSSRSFQLSPLVRVGENLRLLPHANDPSKERGEVWDVPTLKGEVILPPTCAKGEASLGERTLPFLPQVSLDAAYLQEGWKHTALGPVALEAGFFVLGTQDDPKDAALKALLVAPDTLMIEVRDNTWTGPSDKWLVDDHVELWLSPTPPQQLSGCGTLAPAQRPEQWAIRIADSQVFPAYGSPKRTLGVEKVELREANALVGYRLKVVLPTPFGGIGVLYSDSDSGKKQERLLSTSAFKFARSETLNVVRPVPPDEATCVVRNGELAVVPTPLKVEGPDVAALAPPG